ncbi:alpha/beta hydrolase [Massilia sp. TWP1-3-3]|uniref:alpha/beta hydrolase n=1 Tax=Massilia sp. TWP1-3-3 TaxID=2804573 RepID=UPI003CF0766F
MMRTAAGILITAAVLYAFACLVLFLSQRSLIFFPQPRRSGSEAGIMKLRVDDGELNVTTRALTVPDAVLYFGGNAEDVSGSLPDLAAAFSQQALYLMHYRGYGGSAGKPSQAALFADALALFDQVQARHPHVTVIGRSLGSGVALYLASARPVARLVLVTPYDSMVELAAGQFPLMPVRYLMTDKFESWRYAPLVKVPTTLVTAENDAVIPRASTDLLLTRFQPGIARQVVIAGTGHNTVSGSPLYALALAATAR